MKNDTPIVTVNEFEANRLTFKKGEKLYVYDARGYKFAHCPQTGNILTEPKESRLAHINCGLLFRAYDDCGGRYFAFCHADCFDPAMHLVCADSFESAYDIFLDEFADEVDPADYSTDDEREEALNNGVIYYSSGGRLVHSENVQGFELTLIRAENHS
jgi:hypothetical protein